MQCINACILLLTVFGPFLVYSDKLVVLIPNQVRRSPGTRSPFSYRSSIAKRPIQGKYRPFEPQVQILYGKPKPKNNEKSKLDLGSQESLDYSKEIVNRGISFGDGFRNQETRQEVNFHAFPPNKLADKKPIKYSPPDPFNPGNAEEVTKSHLLQSADQIQIKAPKIKSGELSYKHASDIVSDTLGFPNFATSYSSGQNSIIISENSVLDDYNKQIEDFAKSWPKLHSTGTPVLPSPGALTAHNPDALYGVQRSGYAVQEEINEPTPDYRSIITTPFHKDQTVKNVGVSSLISVRG